MMKKLLVMLLSLVFMPVAFAYNATNIKIDVSGAIHDNRYFLCLPNAGCLSILAARNGKVYPIIHPIHMKDIFIVDSSQGFRVSPQGLPSSCNVPVKPNQTVTISGHLVLNADRGVDVNQLHCTVS
jgi:hypothetical protein